MTDQFSSGSSSASTGFLRGPLAKVGTAPSTVRAAFWLLIAGSVVTLAELLIVAISVQQADYGSRGSLVVVSIAAGAGGIALRVYVSVAILRGYGPARIYLSVVTVFAILLEFNSGFDLLGALLIGSIAASVVLVWLPVSSRYFNAVTAARKVDPLGQRKGQFKVSRSLNK